MGATPLFVDRDLELERLNAWLDAALAGHGCTGFIAGEAGAGKTALMAEFARRAQKRHSTLLVASGSCDAPTGVGDAFLPFREILALFTGDVDAGLARGAINEANAERLRRVVARSTDILLEVGLELVDTFVPMGSLIAALARLAKKATGLEKKLADLSERQRPGGPARIVAQEQIFEQYLAFLRRFSSEQPIVILLDDLHWGDGSSISLLFHIARRIESYPILLIGSYRPSEIELGRAGQRHPLEKMLAELKRYGGETTVDLDRSARSNARAFVDALLGSEMGDLGFDFRRMLAERTQGNPLFVVEMLSTLQERGAVGETRDGRWTVDPALDWDALPARVEGVVEERIGRLSKELRRILTIASVEGDQFTAEVIARLQRAEERDLVRQLSDELARQHRLVEATGVERIGDQRISLYRFTHRPVQTYLHRSLDRVERAYLHEDVARLLEDLYTDRLDVIALQLANHYVEAGLAPQAAQYLGRAGELAASRYVHAEAADLFGQALRMTAKGDTASQFSLLLALETAHQWQGKRQEQAEDLAALAALAERMGAPRGAAEVHLRRAEHARLTGRYPEALDQVEQAVAAAVRAAAKDLEARAYGLWGRILIQQDNYSEAEEWLRLAMEMGTANGQLEVAACAQYDLGNTAFAVSHFSDAQNLFADATNLYRALGDRRGVVACLQMSGAVKSKLGDYMGAMAELEEALGMCRSLGWRHGETYVLGALGDTSVELGQYPTATRWHDQCLHVCREVEDHEGEAISLYTLGLIRHRLNQPVEAVGLFKQSLQVLEQIQYRRGMGYALTYLGLAHLDLGQATDALTVLEQALAIRTALDPGSGTLADTLGGLASAAHAYGDRLAAQNYARDALAVLEAAGEEAAEYPAQVYWQCYLVLRTAGAADSAARHALERGQVWVRQQAARIHDDMLRASFLQNVPFNAALHTAS